MQELISVLRFIKPFLLQLWVFLLHRKECIEWEGLSGRSLLWSATWNMEQNKAFSCSHTFERHSKGSSVIQLRYEIVHHTVKRNSAGNAPSKFQTWRENFYNISALGAKFKCHCHLGCFKVSYLASACCSRKPQHTCRSCVRAVRFQVSGIHYMYES